MRRHLTSTWVWQPARPSLGCITAPQLGVTRFCPGLEEPSPLSFHHPGVTSAQSPAAKSGQSWRWEGDGIASLPIGTFEVPAV